MHFFVLCIEGAFAYRLLLFLTLSIEHSLHKITINCNEMTKFLKVRHANTQDEKQNTRNILIILF